MAYDLDIFDADDIGSPVIASGAARFGSHGFTGGMRTTDASTNGQPLASLVDGGNNLVRGTIECWIRHHGATGWQPIFTIPGIGSGLVWDGNDLFVADGVCGSFTSSTITLADNVWYHLAITWNNGTASIYFDGSRVGTGSNSGAISSGFRVGGYNPSNSWAVSGGDIDEFRISTTNRYTGTTYTVPGANFGADSDTVALYHFNGDLLNDTAIRSGRVKYWTGSAWVPHPLKYWDGSTWTTHKLRAYDSASWIEGK